MSIEDEVFEKACEGCEFAVHHEGDMVDPPYDDCSACGDPTDNNCPKHNEVNDILALIEAL